MSHDRDLSASSESKNPLVMKILVDWATYSKLLEAEKFQNKYNHKVTSEMVHKSSKSDILKEGIPIDATANAEKSTDKEHELEWAHETSVKDKEPIQSGSGKPGEFAESMRSVIKEEISNYLKEHLDNFKNLQFAQIGKGAQDIKPEKVETFLENDNEPTPGTSVNEKSVDKQITQVDVADLLSKIPSTYQDNAKNLLAFFLTTQLQFHGTTMEF